MCKCDQNLGFLGIFILVARIGRENWHTRVQSASTEACHGYAETAPRNFGSQYNEDSN
jgi:hypothetical protein